MTERSHKRVTRSAASLAIGPSRLDWDGGALSIRIDEVAAPVPRPIRGVVRLYPRALSTFTAALDTAGLHRWQPIAPTAWVEVDLEEPALRWSGPGYLDSNSGEAPLESSFAGWTWSRAELTRGASVFYDVAERSGTRRSLALRFDRQGAVEPVEALPMSCLPNTGWRIRRQARADPGARPELRETLEDGPFYARSRLRATLFGEAVEALHESLSLDRFRNPLVRLMLPFRMPRVR
jgi:carotenoid 1,2-hydratase